MAAKTDLPTPPSNHARRNRARCDQWPVRRGGPGRPDGSRNALSRDFLLSLERDFEKYGGRVISRVREDHPLAYIRLVARAARSQRVEQIASTPHDADLNPVQQAAAMLMELRQRCGQRGIDALKLLLTLDEADDARDDVPASGESR